jgi:formiminoglutamase/agmatinase
MAQRQFELIGAPFDGGATLGWPGSRYAPARIRAALGWMTMRIQSGEIYSLDSGEIHHVGEQLVVDGGDVAIIPHDLTATLQASASAVSQSIERGRVPILLGGDDSLLLAGAQGLHDAVGGSVGIIHFDAHLDLMDENVRQGRFSHSSGMRRALDLERVSARHCIQVGSRNYNFPSSRAYKLDANVVHISAVECLSASVDAIVARILERVTGAEHLFLSFDIDAIDPAHAPGAGAHEPGGLTSRFALDAVRSLAPYCHAMAITEVNPMTDVGDMTSTLAAYLAFGFAVFGSQEPGAAAAG